MHSTYFRRVLVILVVSLLVVNAASMLSFSMFGRDTYRDIRTESLQAEASVTSAVYQEYLSSNISEEVLLRLIGTQAEANGYAILLTDSTGKTVFHKTSDRGIMLTELGTYFDAERQQVLEGNVVSNQEMTLQNGDKAVSIGIPIVEEGQGVVGSVFIIKAASDIGSSFGRLYAILLLTVLIAVPVVLLVSAYSAERLTRPLYEIADTAMEMSRGDLSVRADENHGGEAGVVAKALNTLCTALAATISQLKSEKNQLSEILQAFTDGVAAIDAQGNLTHYNVALQRMFGSVSADTPMDLIPDAGIWDVYRKAERERARQDMRYTLPGERTLMVTVVPVLSEDGVCTGIVGLFTDVTEYERLEQTRRDYVANVSHELRAPLTAIRGYLEPLSDGLVKDQDMVARYYQVMLREVVRMSKLITDLLQLSRLQSGTEYMDLEAVNLEELFTDILENESFEAGKRGISLELSLPDGLPPAMTSRDRVEQVIVILIDNAMRYTPEGGSITLSAIMGERIEVSVADTGCGIEQAELPHLFERFYKVDKSRHEGGTGLGLSIAKQIMDRLGESIRVESTVGKGTTFTFTLQAYISNAIALGPVSNGRGGPAKATPAVSGGAALSPDDGDAAYEILDNPKKKKSTRRHTGKHGS